MNILTSTEALARINERLGTPVNRLVFQRTLIPLMARAGDARLVARRQASVVDEIALERWIAYLVAREQKIAAGEWKYKRPYSIEDMDAITEE